MSRIQPGSGYGFTSGGYGFTLNTENPFPEKLDGGACKPLLVKYDSYDAGGNSHFFKVCVGAVNNLVPQIDEDSVWVKLDRVTEGVPDPPVSVINVTSGIGVIYLRCGNVEGDEEVTPEYPDSDDTSEGYPRIISEGGSTVPSDSDTYSYLLLANVLIDEDENATITPVVMNSLWSARFQCASEAAQYFWSTI
jgi:hypothetical protein